MVFKNYRLQVGEGLNPQQWVEISKGSSPDFGWSTGRMGYDGKNGLFAIRLLVVRDDNHVETALSQVTVDNLPPVIDIISPQEGAAVSGAKSVFMQVGISDTSGISSVQWQIDGIQVGEGKQAPFTFEWTQPVRGNHTLTVSATDTAGNQGLSKPLKFIVE